LYFLTFIQLFGYPTASV